MVLAQVKDEVRDLVLVQGERLVVEMVQGGCQDLVLVRYANRVRVLDCRQGARLHRLLTARRVEFRSRRPCQPLGRPGLLPMPNTS